MNDKNNDIMGIEKELENRLMELEAHVAHQDSMIDDLNDMTAKQWTTIDKLERQVSDLKSRIESIEENAGRAPVSEPPPPHH